MNDAPDLPAGLRAGSDALEAVLAPALAPLFLRPARIGIASDWHAHVPFAHWLIAAARPRLVVEIGTASGVSLAAFCEAMTEAGLATTCLAIADPTATDLTAVRRFSEARHAAFCTIADDVAALDAVEDGAIDLLHLGDGTPPGNLDLVATKLSAASVVLVHGIGVSGNEAARLLWRRWAGSKPHFAFLHGVGLGVIAWGPAPPVAVARLCHLSDGAEIAALRDRFAFLGDAVAATERAQAMTQPVLARGAAALEQALAANRAARANLAAARNDGMLLAARMAEREALHTTALADAAAEIAERDALIQRLRAARAARLAAWLHWGLGTLRGRKPARPGPLAPLPPPAATTMPAVAIPPATSPPRALFISGEAHTPGHEYRVLRPMALAQSLGWRADWAEAALVNPAILDGARIVLLWRVAWSPHIEGILDYARAQGASIIFDVDDLMFRSELATVEVIDGIRSQGFSEFGTQELFRNIARAMRKCYVVTCTTETLARHVRRAACDAFVLPNGFDAATLATSRHAARNWRDCADGLIRIGYAGGSRTHQRDFAVALPALVRVLHDHPDTRLVLFRDPRSGQGVVLAEEFPELEPLSAQIEWRDMVSLAELPKEIARFDINLAPLETGNPFCEAKSELKIFEAALVSVPTIASPTEPFRGAIEPGVDGFLAATESEWHAALTRLVHSPELRRQLAQQAYHRTLARFGPERRRDRLASLFDQLKGGCLGGRAFELDIHRGRASTQPRPVIPDSETLFYHDAMGDAAVSVIVPVYNYAQYVLEALESVRTQTTPLIDLIVIDDRSTDDGVPSIVEWMQANTQHLNRAIVLRHRENAGLGHARNSGFAAAETPYILPLDADNRLRPECCATLAKALDASDASFAYPAIQQFGDRREVFGTEAFSALHLTRGNYIDAMALVRKSAWAEAGGYDVVRHGWEDYDFWCRLLEHGRFGTAIPDTLADYRVHRHSMLHTETETARHKPALVADLQHRHPWLDVTGLGQK